MAARVRAKSDASYHFIYHKGLIKLLIENHLRKINRTWEHFLFWGCFLESVSPKPKATSRRKRSKKIVEPPQTLEQGTSFVQTRSQGRSTMREPPPPLVPKMERVYTRRSGRLWEKKNLSPSHMPYPEQVEPTKPTKETEAEVVEPETKKT